VKTVMKRQWLKKETVAGKEYWVVSTVSFIFPEVYPPLQLKIDSSNRKNTFRGNI
jgi:hypothetical protein